MNGSCVIICLVLLDCLLIVSKILKNTQLSFKTEFVPSCGHVSFSLDIGSNNDSDYY